MAFQVYRSPQSKGSNPETLPTPGDPTGPCPWCGLTSNFDVQRHGALSMKNTGHSSYADRSLATLTCQGCKRGTAVVTANNSREGLMWFPTPGMGLLDRQVNSEVASTYDEGMRCLAIGANRAAAVMFRSSLSLFVKDKGSEKAKGERHLKTALNHMKQDHSLHPSLSEWADHLNQLGNEGAHPEDYDEVTADEARELGEFVRHLIRHEYEMPAQLKRSRGLLTDNESDTDEVGPSASASDHRRQVPLVNPGDPQGGS